MKTRQSSVERPAAIARALGRFGLSLLLLAGGSLEANAAALWVVPGSDRWIPQHLAYLEAQQSAIAANLLARIDRHRRDRGLAPLRLDDRLNALAAKHSAAMASGAVPFGHGGFEDHRRAIARTLPYRQIAENVASNQGFADPAQRAVAGWLRSPDHRKNIEGDYQLTGIGIARSDRGTYYFTQLFVRLS